MGSTDNSQPEYKHGSDASEQARLENMVKILGGADFLPPLRSGMRVLEVGCGTGSITRDVAAKVAPGEVVGVDQQAAQLQTARRLAADRGIANLRFHQASATALDFPDACFDGVYCRFLLEHVAKPVDVIREMARLVKPGGWVCAFEWENDCDVNYPECPAAKEVWRALYDLQAAMGGDAFIARKLFEVFKQAGLDHLDIKGGAWSITADAKDKLRIYVDGAREIIRQAQDRLLSENHVSQELLRQADDEYQRLLESPAAFVMGGNVRVTGARIG